MDVSGSLTSRNGDNYSHAQFWLLDEIFQKVCHEGITAQTHELAHSSLILAQLHVIERILGLWLFLSSVGPRTFTRFSKLMRIFLLVPKRMAWKTFGTSFSTIGRMLGPVPSPSLLCLIFLDPARPAASISSEMPRATWA